MQPTDNLRRPVQNHKPTRYLRAAVVFTVLLYPTIALPWTDQPSESSTPPKPEKSSAATTPNLEEKSRARAVAVADVIGTVTIQRPGATAESPMVVSTPIQEGFRITTAAASSTGIQLEHDSTAIVGAHSRVVFDQMELDANGNRLTSMTLQHGLVTVHVLPQRHATASTGAQADSRPNAVVSPGSDIFEIKIAEVRATAEAKCRFRVDVKAGYVRVEVFKGEVNFATPGQSVTLAAGKSLEHKLGRQETAFDIHKGIVKDPWDTWTLTEEQKILSEPKSASHHGRQSDEATALMGQRRSESSSPSANWAPTRVHHRY
jgi:hypothetical protein